jgi:hypothetical protein
MSDAELQRIRTGTPGITEDCLDKMKWGGIEAAPTETDQCYKMLPATRWHGLWRDGFEGQIFCPAPAQECPGHSPKDESWFELKSRPPGVEKDPLGALYAVDFIGRRTAQSSSMIAYGFQHEMVVDRMISVRLVEPAPLINHDEFMEAMIAEEARGTFRPNAEFKKQMQEYIESKGKRGQK